MADEPKSRTTVWTTERDRNNMATIKQVYNLASDSAAIRFALQRAVNEVEERHS